MCQKYPVFRLFEDAWPVRAYVERYIYDARRTNLRRGGYWPGLRVSERRKRSHSDTDEDNQFEPPPKASRANRQSNNMLIDLTVEPHAEDTSGRQSAPRASRKTSRTKTYQRSALLVDVEVDAIDLLLSSQKKPLAHLRPALRALGIEDAVSHSLIHACGGNLDEPGLTDGFGLYMRFGHAIS
jgi:hypothetical protein